MGVTIDQLSPECDCQLQLVWIPLRYLFPSALPNLTYLPAPARCSDRSLAHLPSSLPSLDVSEVAVLRRRRRRLLLVRCAEAPQNEQPVSVARE